MTDVTGVTREGNLNYGSASVGDSIEGHIVGWSKFTEEMLASWCDEAKCFEWMHNEACSRYTKKSRRIIIYSNVLTTISGVSNVITGGSTVGGFSLAYIFGSVSILISIMNMLQEKLGYGTAAVEHRQYSTLWGILRRKIEEELSVSPESRTDCGTFLKMARQDINKVSIDGSSKIPEDIRDLCYSKFSTIRNFDVPDICGALAHTKIFVREVNTFDDHRNEIHEV